MTASQAIARSVSHNEIVTIEFNTYTEHDLLAACEDWTGNPTARRTEFWGTDNDGNEWRVHMRAEPEGEEP